MPLGMSGGAGHSRVCQMPSWAPQVVYDFNIKPIVPALPDIALAPSHASFPATGPRATPPLLKTYELPRPLRRGANALVSSDVTGNLCGAVNKSPDLATACMTLR